MRRVLACTLIWGCLVPSLGADEPAEVRQLVTFRFQPGRTAEALELFADLLRPIYREASALIRLRAYRGFLIADGWAYLRFLGFDSLGAIHAYLDGRRAEPFSGVRDRMIVATKQIVVREDDRLAVR